MYVWVGTILAKGTLKMKDTARNYKLFGFYTSSVYFQIIVFVKRNEVLVFLTFNVL